MSSRHPPRTSILVVFLLVAHTASAAPSRVMLMSDRDDLRVALRLALAGRDIDVITGPLGDGLRLEHAARAQRAALASQADAAVWLENSDVCIVSAAGEHLRCAAVPAGSSERVMAAIAISLLDEIVGLPEPPPRIQLQTSPVVNEALEPMSTSSAATLAVSVGPYLATRGMTFGYDPDGSGRPPEYNPQKHQGIAVSAVLQPKQLPIGVSLQVAKAVGASFTGHDDTGYGDYQLQHLAWELDAQARKAIGPVTLGLLLGAGNDSYTIVDLPESIQLPDTSTSYVAAGVRGELASARDAVFSAGARYLRVTGMGDLTSTDWYGAGKAWGAILDMAAAFSLSKSFFVRAALEYRRVHVNFDGSGMLSNAWGVWDVTDSALAGTTQLGMQF